MVSETVESKANEVLLQMLNGVEQAGDFVVAQAPDVVRQLLLWHTIDSLIGFVLGLALLVGSPCAWVRLSRFFQTKKAEYRQDYDNGEPWTRFSGRPESTVTSTDYDAKMGAANISPTVIGVGGIVIGTFMTFGNLTWLKILIAPKLYLIEYAAMLVK